MANDISTSFNDREMFLTQPNWGEDITSKVALERRILQQIGGVKTISQINTDAPITVNSDFTLMDRESIYNLLNFFDQRKGGTESFWFLHPARFFTLKQTYGSGNSYIVVNRNYGDKWTQSLPSQYDWGIYIEMHNGDLICRKVTGITDQTDSSRIYLDETIPRNITTDNHFIIGRTLVGRFDQNQVSIDFSTQGVGKASLQLKENYREYDTWVPEDGYRYWTVENVSSGANAGTARAQTLVAPFSGNIINSWTNYPFGGSSGQGYYYNIYVKFYNVSIPPGALIVNATVTFVCSIHTLSGAGFNFDFSFADYDSIPAFSTVSAWKALNRTTAINWSVATGTWWTVEEQYTTPNLAQAMQDIVDRPGWVKNSSVLLCGDQLTDMGWVYRYWKRPVANVQPRLKVSWV